MKRSTSNRLKRNERVYNEIIANHIFFGYYNTRPLEEVCKRIVQYSGVIKKLILILDEYDNIHYQQFKKEFGKFPKYRSNGVAYNYESIESIKGNLSYISDRFKCDLRLRWLLGVPDAVKNLN